MRYALAPQVDAVQKYIVAPAFSLLLKKTSSGVTASGIEYVLEHEEKGATIVSTHLTIPLDAALIGWCLVNHGARAPWSTPGTNLYTQSGVKGWMIRQGLRYNKTIPVPRKATRGTVEPLFERIAEVQEAGEYLWCAHRKGRDKRGMLQTDPGVLRMLRKAANGTDAPRIYIPAAISYEHIPDAERMARQVHTGLTNRSEDSESIKQDLRGYKGRIHVGFGPGIEDRFDNENQFAAALDEQIKRHYALWPSTFIAAALLRDKEVLAGELLTLMPENEQARAERYVERVNQAPAALRPHMHKIHAGPLDADEDLVAGVQQLTKDGIFPKFIQPSRISSSSFSKK